MSDHRKHNVGTTASQRKKIIDLLKNRKFIVYGPSNILDNTYGCADHYICATELYLLYIQSQAFDIVIDHEISAPGHAREVLDDLNATYK